jgi:hypothetical protein
MTSREHARRLMLILLSSQAGPDAAGEQTGEPADERQTPDGRDDSTDGDERRTTRRVDALTLT